MTQGLMLGVALALLGACAEVSDQPHVTVELRPVDSEEEVLSTDLLDEIAEKAERRLRAIGIENAQTERLAGATGVAVAFPADADVDRVVALLSRQKVELAFHLVAQETATDIVLRKIEDAFPGRLVQYLRPEVEERPNRVKTLGEFMQNRGHEPFSMAVGDIGKVREVVAEALKTPDLIPGDRTVAFGKEPADAGATDRVPVYVIEAKPCFSGEGIISATTHRDGNRGDECYRIMFELDDDSGARLGEVSAANINRAMAIVVDGVILSAPVIQSKITTSVMISGDFLKGEAEDIAAALASGPMPVPITVTDPEVTPSESEAS